ncbi:hypothetical protein D3C86_1630080 [compost metagenome]
MMIPSATNELYVFNASSTSISIKLASEGYTFLTIGSPASALPRFSLSATVIFIHSFTCSMFVRAFKAMSCVAWLMLYGGFTLFNTSITGRAAKAIPRRRAASPHALEKVCSTTRFGYSVSSLIKVRCLA